MEWGKWKNQEKRWPQLRRSSRKISSLYYFAECTDSAWNSKILSKTYKADKGIFWRHAHAGHRCSADKRLSWQDKHWRKSQKDRWKCPLRDKLHFYVLVQLLTRDAQSRAGCKSSKANARNWTERTDQRAARADRSASGRVRILGAALWVHRYASGRSKRPTMERRRFSRREDHTKRSTAVGWKSVLSGRAENGQGLPLHPHLGQISPRPWGRGKRTFSRGLCHVRWKKAAHKIAVWMALGNILPPAGLEWKARKAF